ncbi:hypothetical protein BMF94_5626 [Rhodotorula taiwanensis]|uniref:Alcohol dehydrogenase-like N-terminal domain-containing protein n=1 Tax=Rhodotorula taiwanensis TaxID=741276 RepID=A0A2S5B3F0_9BASI|nr:hypothetical protein BMF94_5626 [Rhodotorula taiwanensis]
MAMNALANVAEKVRDAVPTTITNHLSNPAQQKEEFADPSGEKMKALVWDGPMKVKVEESLKPKIVDPKDIILKVTGTTVCGSDMHLLAGAIIELQKHDILGHETMGIVESVGPEVKHIKVGDRLVSGFNIACGECFMCQKKLSSACVKANASSTMQSMYGNRTCGMLGYSHFTGGFAGGQAEYVRIPYGEANCIKIPDGVYDEDALYLSDSLVTSFHQVEDTGVEEGDVVGIWGAGVIGLLCGVWSAMRGASHLIAIDNAQWRLDDFETKIKRDYHNIRIDTINFDEVKNVTAKVQELTQGGTNGLPETRPAGLDVALECAAGEYAKGWGHKIELAMGLETDSSEILNEMITSTINFGRVGVTGVYAGFTNHFNIGSLMQRGIRFIGNGQAPTHKYMQRILDDYIVTGKIKPRELFVSHRVPIEDIAKVYYSMREHDPKDKILKPFVTTAASAPPAPGAPPLTRL